MGKDYTLNLDMFAKLYCHGFAGLVNVCGDILIYSTSNINILAMASLGKIRLAKICSSTVVVKI